MDNSVSLLLPTPSDFVEGSSATRVTFHAESNNFNTTNPRSKTRSVIAEPMFPMETLLTQGATLSKSSQSFPKQDSKSSLKRKLIDSDDDATECEAAKRFRKSEKKRRKRERRAARVAQIAEQSILDTDVMLPTEPPWQILPNQSVTSPFGVTQHSDEWSLPPPSPRGAHTSCTGISPQSRFECLQSLTESDPSSFQNVHMVSDHERKPLPNLSSLQMLPSRPTFFNGTLPLPPATLDASYAGSAHPQKSDNSLHHRVTNNDIAAKQDLLDRTISQNKEALVHLGAPLTKEQKAGVMRAICERNKFITQLTSEIKSHLALRTEHPTPPKATRKFKWPETEFPLYIVISDEDELSTI